MWTQVTERRCWLLSKAMETCSSLDEALQLAKEAEAFLALADDAEVPVLAAIALQPSTAEVVKAKIAAIADSEAQSTVVVPATEVEAQPATISELGSGDAAGDSAPGNCVVGALSVFAVPEDVTRYLCRQGIPVEATVTGRYKVDGRLETLSLLRMRANALRARQNLPPFELMPTPAV
jgi:hypothetical protein